MNEARRFINKYKSGCNWLNENMQVTGLNIAVNATPYNHDRWMKGLRIIEEMEDYMRFIVDNKAGCK